MEGEEEEEENRRFSVPLGCSPPTSLAVPSQDLLPAAWRRLSRQWLGFPLTAWKWPPGRRATQATGILRAVGSGTRKTLYETQRRLLSSKIFNEEKFSQGSPRLVTESGPALGTAGSWLET